MRGYGWTGLLTIGMLLIEPPEDPAPQAIVLPVELVARASTRPA